MKSFSASKDTQAVKKELAEYWKLSNKKICEFSSFIRLGHLRPGDPVEEMVYEFLASRTLLLCEQTVFEDAPAQEMNPGFSYPPYSMIL